MSKYYVNFKCQYSGDIETIEGLECKRKDAILILNEYKLVDSGYYISKRATKQYYYDLKAGL